MPTPLEKILIHKISQHGAISVADFMATALYHPQYGYYTTQNPFQDFTTAPELTPLFGETLTVWLVQTWQAMGSPQKFNLIECGPGQGTLMSDILTTLKKISPPTYAAAQMHLIEISPRLTQVQQEKLTSHPNITWHTDITHISTPHRPTILIANEFLDAFPIHQYTKINGTWQEICVTHNPAQKFHFTQQNAPKRFTHATENDSFIEDAPQQKQWLSTLTQHLTGPTTALFIDYAITGGNTLQALKNHQFINVLDCIGTADITAHVNFPALQAHLPPNTTQLLDMSTFLTQYGLPLRLNQLLQTATLQQTTHLHAIADRLLSPAHMGSLFKCMIYKNNF